MSGRLYKIVVMVNGKTIAEGKFRSTEEDMKALCMALNMASYGPAVHVNITDATDDGEGR